MPAPLMFIGTVDPELVSVAVPVNVQVMVLPGGGGIFVTVTVAVQREFVHAIVPFGVAVDGIAVKVAPGVAINVMVP
jgi:hypothetical protein